MSKKSAPAKRYDSQTMFTQHFSCLINISSIQCITPNSNAFNTGSRIILCRLFYFPRFGGNGVNTQPGKICMFFGCSLNIEKSIVRFIINYPLKIKRHFTGMIISPHAGFSIWNFASSRNIIPSIGPVINGMQQQSLVFWIGTEIRLIKNGIQNS